MMRRLQAEDPSVLLEIEVDGERILTLRFLYRSGRCEMNWTSEAGFSYQTWIGGGTMLQGAMAGVDGADLPRTDEVDALRKVEGADSPEAVHALELLAALASERARRRALTAPKVRCQAAEFAWFELATPEKRQAFVVFALECIAMFHSVEPSVDAAIQADIVPDLESAATSLVEADLRRAFGAVDRLLNLCQETESYFEPQLQSFSASNRRM